MDNPDIDREYCFVRLRDGNTEWATFTRFADGSAYVVDANYERIFEERDGAWEIALNWLRSEEFVPQHEAIQRSMIPASWTPPNQRG